MAKVSKSRGEQYFLLHPGKAGTMDLPVPMDDKAMARINEKLAAITAERLGVENKKRDMTAPLNKRLAELRQSEKNLVGEREAGQTTAPVQVQERASFEEGVAWMVRLDTGLEVPNTRRPLTHAERQSFVPGKGDEEPGRIFPRAVEDAREEDEELDEDASAEGMNEELPLDVGTTEVPSAGEWKKPLGSFEAWRVEESLGKEGERLYLLTNDSRAFGPFEYSEGFHAPGKRDGLPEDVRTAIAIMFHEAPPADGADSYTERFILAAENAVDERVALLADLQSVADALAGKPVPPPAIPAEGTPGARVGELHMLSGHPGWGLYVHEGHAYFRAPNVDSFEPAASSKDKGPFAWDATERMLDAVDGAPVGDEWLKQYSRMLEEADFLITERKVEVKAMSPKAKSSAAVDGLPSESEAPAGDEDVAVEPEAPPVSSSDAADVPTMAKKLSDPARKVVKLLATPGAPGDAPTIGNRANCKAGSVLNGLLEKRLVTYDGSWCISPLGAEVAAELVRMAEAKSAGKS